MATKKRGHAGKKAKKLIGSKLQRAKTLRSARALSARQLMRDSAILTRPGVQAE